MAIIEGVMGLYDGYGYDDESGSTAEVAKLLACPVVLVMDAAKIARSAAALVSGYCQFDRDVPLAGFIVNRVGSDRHGQGVARAIEQATGKPVFGWIGRDARLELPERHLGLVPTAEPGAWQTFLDAAADTVRQNLDLDALLAAAKAAPPPPEWNQQRTAINRIPRADSPKPVIAVARDEAFHFTYPENLELLAEAGADIVYFSPLVDHQLPDGTAAIALSGGFPELYARSIGRQSVAGPCDPCRARGRHADLCRMRWADGPDRIDHRSRRPGARDARRVAWPVAND